jgi:peptidoglycan/LPS O-acetylase OafA/YrhL
LSGHIPALDGVRGIAILAVCAMHMTVLSGGPLLDRLWMQAGVFGFSGVDLFFVLSGFLITGILLDSKSSAHYFRNFYARRVLRIFPLYYAFLAVVLLVMPRFHQLASHTLGPDDGSAAWYWTYLCNFAIARHRSFPRGPLSVTWSLAVEEQFYMLWPAVVLLLSRRRLIQLCLALGIVALLTRVVLWSRGADWITLYVLTPCRMDSLAAGALVAAVARGPGGVPALLPWARRCAVAALLLAIALICWQGTHWTFVPPAELVGYTVLAALFSSFLPIAISSPACSLMGRVLGGRVLGLFGRYSYAIYLFHDPIRTLIREKLLDPNLLPTVLGSHVPAQLLFYAVALTLTTGLAWLSWTCFERPLLRLKRFFPSGKRAHSAVLLPATSVCPA